MLLIDDEISKITENLTGDSEKDLKYLLHQMDLYRDHEYSTEIVRAIGRIFYDILPEEKVNEFVKVAQNFEIYCENVLYHANDCIVKKDFKEAERLLDIIYNLRNLYYQDDKETEYRYFRNFFEHVFYMLKYKPKREIKIKPFYYRDMYNLYGFLLVEIRNLEKAREVLNEAIKCNPVDTGMYFELGETYKIEGNWEEFKKNTDKAFECSYTSENLARCYRNYGFYFVEMENYEAAIAAFVKSTKYQDSTIAMSEMFYIQQVTGKQVVMDEYFETCDDILENNLISSIPDKELFIHASNAALGFESQGKYSIALIFFKVLYDISKLENFSDKIKELSEKPDVEEE